MEANERSTLVTECPLCGSGLEGPEVQDGPFLEYVCPACGLKWQACIAPEALAYPQAAQAWMQRVAQD